MYCTEEQQKNLLGRTENYDEWYTEAENKILVSKKLQMLKAAWTVIIHSDYWISLWVFSMPAAFHFFLRPTEHCAGSEISQLFS